MMSEIILQELKLLGKLQVNNTLLDALSAVVSPLTKQPLKSTTQLWIERNLKLMNYTAVEKYEGTSAEALLQRIR